jgi:hypothetical protein
MSTRRGARSSGAGHGKRQTARTERQAGGPVVGARRQRPFVPRHRGAILAGVVLALLVAFGVIFAIKFGPSNAVKEQAAGDQPADPAVVSALTRIPPATFDSVGTGSASDSLKPIVGGAALTSGGKPEVLYVGAEYCPYCAAERWALIAALSRFGSFANLHTTRSAAGDVYANTASFTFYQANYSSPYLALAAVEQYTNQPAASGGYTRLQSLSSEQQSLISRYDKAPYAASANAIPFVDFGGKAVLSGATYNPGILGGMDWQQIAAKLGQPSSAQARAIIGSANLLTAAICQMIKQQPGSVCQSQGVQKAAALLKKGT